MLPRERDKQATELRDSKVGLNSADQSARLRLSRPPDLRLRGIAEPAHRLVEVIGNHKRVVETGKYANRPTIRPIARMEAGVTPTGGTGSPIEFATLDELPRRNAPLLRKLEIDSRAKTVHEDPSGQIMIGVTQQARIRNRAESLAT